MERKKTQKRSAVLVFPSLTPRFRPIDKGDGVIQRERTSASIADLDLTKKLICKAVKGKDILLKNDFFYRLVS
jgi:hypothetical protein